MKILKRKKIMEKDITGKNELEMLSFDWNLKKPALILTYTTFCCASGTCDDFILKSKKEENKEIKRILCDYDNINPFDINNRFGSLR